MMGTAQGVESTKDGLQQGVQKAKDDILGKAEEEFADEPAGSSELDRQSFMKMLLTQLENQDPTDPMKDRDFVAQLAQFSSLEQLINLNDGMESMQEEQLQDRMLGAVSYVGQELRADGGQISKDDSGTSTVFYELEESAQDVVFDIYNQDDKIIDSVSQGPKAAGESSFNWDGTDYQGQEVEAGLYRVEPRAEGENGEELEVKTDISGKVEGVGMQEESIVLTLADGREVQLDQIKEVLPPEQDGDEQE
ncbi:MAG: flagellar hook capping FlgD N-terminal domain-containing protein [Desulfohalobiaceae bacterium]